MQGAATGWRLVHVPHGQRAGIHAGSGPDIQHQRRHVAVGSRAGKSIAVGCAPRVIHAHDVEPDALRPPVRRQHNNLR